jgi:hypothetical protein
MKKYPCSYPPAVSQPHGSWLGRWTWPMAAKAAKAARAARAVTVESRLRSEKIGVI